MSLKQVFKSTLESVNYICGNGKPIIFRDYEYVTDMEYDIAQLQAEIAAGHPYISYAGEKDMDIKAPNELIQMLVDKEIERRFAATNPDNQMGDYIPAPLMPANSSNVAEAAAGGSGVNMAALKVALAGKAVSVPSVDSTSTEVK